MPGRPTLPTQGLIWPTPCHPAPPLLQLASREGHQAQCTSTRRPPRHPWGQCPWWHQQQQQASHNLGPQRQGTACQYLGPSRQQQQQRWRHTQQRPPAAAALSSRGPTGARWWRSQRLSRRQWIPRPPTTAAAAAGQRLAQVKQRHQGAPLVRRCSSRQACSYSALPNAAAALHRGCSPTTANHFMAYGTVRMV
jgi:hypothetical protein